MAKGQPPCDQSSAAAWQRELEDPDEEKDHEDDGQQTAASPCGRVALFGFGLASNVLQTLRHLDAS